MKKKKIMAILMAAATMASVSTPVFAAGNEAYTGVTGSNNVVFEKYLTMDSQSNVPNVTFNFTISGNVKQLDSDGSTTLKVYAGNDTNAVSGEPAIASATFKQEQDTYTEVQDEPTSVTVQNKTDGTDVDKDAVTLDSGQKYARSDIKADFSNVIFKEPGVYRYLITETANDTNAGHGFTNDNDNTRVLDVYVIDNNGTLEVQGYVLQNAEPDGTVLRDGTGATQKSDGYVNNYETEDLTISKTVSGNQASHDEYFKITVKIENDVDGNVYNVVLDNADATTKTNAINTTTHTNPATLTIGNDGSVTQDFWLQDGQQIVIQGIAKNAKYTVNEDANTLGKESYDPSAEITGDTVTGTTAGTEGDTTIAMASDTYTVSDSAITADTTVAFTNTKEGTIPTGVATAIGGGLAFLAAGGIGLTITRRRKTDDEEA